MLAQARVLAKYAAYRAVRVGVMQHANVDKMRDAAILTLLPTISLPIGKTVAGSAFFWPGTKASDSIPKAVAISFAAVKAATFAGLSPVNVVICGPLSKDLNGARQQQLTGAGSNNQVDFDDPRVATEDTASGTVDGTSPTFGLADYTKYMRTKLRIQVQYYYVMPIPFANWIMARTLVGLDLPDILRMSHNGLSIPKLSGQASTVLAAYAAGLYIAPINVSYAMRMQSNFYLNLYKLPDANNCIHYPTS